MFDKVNGLRQGKNKGHGEITPQAELNPKCFAFRRERIGHGQIDRAQEKEKNHPCERYLAPHLIGQRYFSAQQQFQAVFAHQLHHADGRSHGPRQDGFFQHDEAAVVQPDGQPAEHHHQNQAEPLRRRQFFMYGEGIYRLNHACHYGHGGGGNHVAGDLVSNEKQDDGNKIA